MRILLISTVLLYMGSGCMMVESATRIATDAALDAIEQKTGIPLGGLKEWKDKLLEEGAVVASKKAAQVSQAAFIAMANKAGVPTEGKTNDEIKMSLEEKGGILAVLALLLLKIATMGKRWYDAKNGKFQPVEVVKAAVAPTPPDPSRKK